MKNEYGYFLEIIDDQNKINDNRYLDIYLKGKKEELIKQLKSIIFLKSLNVYKEDYGKKFKLIRVINSGE